MSDAQIPGSHVSHAISQIISNVLPPHAYEFLFALVPGLFFEISVLLADPARSSTLSARARDGLGLGHNGLIGVAIFLGFIIGTTFILLVLFIQSLLGFAYRLRNIVWEEFCASVLVPFTTRLQQKQWWQNRGRLRALTEYARYMALKRFQPDQSAGAIKCWTRFARRLLQIQYGVDPQDLGQEEWDALFWPLGVLNIVDLRGSIVMLAFEATGWCGLVAARLASALRNQHYLVFCAVLIVSGVFHDWHIARNLNDPRSLGTLKIRALLREFRVKHDGLRFASQSAPDERPDSGSDVDGD
jgi:hypothetical protein